MSSQKILITGASGNIGHAIIRSLTEQKTRHNIIAASYNVERTKAALAEFDGLSFRRLDFADQSSFCQALQDIDIVFLLRPPQLADIPRYFEPFIRKMVEMKITKIVFLSVQGVETQKMIPHHKLEKLIEAHKLDYIFLRPGYFMQNLTTTLYQDIKEKNRIYIPSGPLKFNWVDALDVGKVGAATLNDFEHYKNKSFEITGSEFEGFQRVAALITQETGRKIKYVSPNLLSFYFYKKRQGMAAPMILVMIMLHWLPRFGKNKPRLANTVLELTGSVPQTLKQFIIRNREKFMA